MLETVLGIALLGFLVWLIVTYIPMPPIFKNVIIVLVVVWVILRVLPMFGISVP